MVQQQSIGDLSEVKSMRVLEGPLAKAGRRLRDSPLRPIDSLEYITAFQETSFPIFRI